MHITQDLYNIANEETRLGYINDTLAQIARIKEGKHELSNTADACKLGNIRAQYEKFIYNVIEWETSNQKNTI